MCLDGLIMKRFRWLSSLLLVVVWVTGCATVPETGRKRPGFLVSEAAALQMGLDAFSQTKQEVPVSQNAAANQMLQRVGARIAAVAPLPNAQWEFVLFESEQANAFCLPGGKVGVYTGLLPLTQDETGLATVTGHEVAHAVAEHGRERVTYGMYAEGGAQLITAATESSDPKWQALARTAYPVLVQVGGLLPYSRVHESEADEIGLLYMARAGYDPEGAIAFWERFAEYGRKMGDTTPAWLRTHPGGDVRIEQIKGWMPRAKQEYRSAASQ